MLFIDMISINGLTLFLLLLKYFLHKHYVLIIHAILSANNLVNGASHFSGIFPAGIDMLTEALTTVVITMAAFQPMNFQYCPVSVAFVVPGR